MKVTFVSANGVDRRTVEAKAGQSVLEVAHLHDIPIEGACEGSMVCSTCHVIVKDDFYDRLPEPSIEEEDLLDLAVGLAPTSRLGCQIVLTEDLDGLVVQLPRVTNNLMSE